MKTMQEQFDIVVEHLSNQIGRSYDGQACNYMDSQGRKCAVGVLLPEGHIVFKEANTYALREILGYYVDLQKVLCEQDTPHYFLLRDLQVIHDNSDNWDLEDHFIRYDLLMELADKFSLEYYGPIIKS